ncbi:MAG: SIR2 family NAD-dependent protein deacylase, partial [Acidimicrobiia bacterium]
MTTNYEHSLHDACARARRRWVQPIERDTLRGATLSREFFVARIHGSAEQPTTMVVDATDYRLLRGDATYLDFLLHILSARSCLFLGFSFLDPAISHVLDIYAERFGPTYRALHTAIVPSGDDGLARRLLQLNIETVLYDSADGHAVIWRAIRETSEAMSRAPIPDEQPREDVLVDVTAGYGPVHRFVAFTYAQARVRGEAQPVIGMAQDGIVASILSEQPSGVMTEPDLTAAVAGILRISSEEAARSLSTRMRQR